MLQKNKFIKSTLSILLVLLLTITCMPITASAATTELEVADFEIEPITVTEYTNGAYVYEFNPATGKDALIYKYYLDSKLKFTVTLKDGTKIKGDYGSFYYDNKRHYFDVFAIQTYTSQWKAGNTYSMTVSLYGISKEVPVTITESPFVSMEVKPVKLYENTHGYFYDEYNPKTGENDLRYYRYNPDVYMEYTITLDDGSKINGENSAFKYNGETYHLEIEYTQTYETRWTVGNTYNMKVSFCGFTADVPVTIEESPFEKLEIKPITLNELENGRYTTEYNFETGEYLEYFLYSSQLYIDYTITLKDGTTISGYKAYFDYEGERYNFETQTGQSYKNQWKAGNTYIMNVHIGGLYVNVPVTIKSTKTATLKGDANNDGLITIEDVTVVQEYIARYITLTDESALNADVDGSGDINIVDATYIQLYVAKLIANFDTI